MFICLRKDVPRFTESIKLKEKSDKCDEINLFTKCNDTNCVSLYSVKSITIQTTLCILTPTRIDEVSTETPVSTDFAICDPFASLNKINLNKITVL